MKMTKLTEMAKEAGFDIKKGMEVDGIYAPAKTTRLNVLLLNFANVVSVEHFLWMESICDELLKTTQGHTNEIVQHIKDQIVDRVTISEFVPWNTVAQLLDHINRLESEVEKLQDDL